MKKWILSLTLGLACASASAHGPNDMDIEPFIAVMSDIADLTPEIVTTSGASQATIKVAGHHLALNGPFWQLVRGWIRVYYHQLQEDCDHCLPGDEHQFEQSAEDHIARTFFELKVNSPLRESIEHIAVGTADIGARLGPTALVSKVSSEVAETVLSKMVGGGGVHIVCNLIDAAIIFGTRHIQSAWRSFAWAPRLGSSGLTTLIRHGFVSSSAARAFKRVQFVAVADGLNEEALREVDLEGPNRWWGYAREGKRAQWVRKFLRNGSARVSKREYLGGRMKRYLLLKGRKRGHSQYMRGNNPMDQVLTGNVLWILAVQENILERSLRAGVDSNELPTMASKFGSDTDEIRQGLAEEFARGHTEKARLMDGLMKEVEVIFNPEAPSRLRYAQVAILESVLTGFVYGTFGNILNEKGELHGNSWSGIGRQFRLRWKTGRFASYIYEWADFLRVAALQKDPDKLYRHKYEMMEVLSRLFEHFGETQSLMTANSRNDLEVFEREFAVREKRLRSFKPWREKRIAYSWIPFRRPMPMCRDMNAAVEAP